MWHVKLERLKPTGRTQIYFGWQTLLGKKKWHKAGQVAGGEQDAGAMPASSILLEGGWAETWAFVTGEKLCSLQYLQLELSSGLHKDLRPVPFQVNSFLQLGSKPCGGKTSVEANGVGFLTLNEHLHGHSLVPRRLQSAPA